jgi:glycosyltransferase involved in cell wall biosynthesis
VADTVDKLTNKAQTGTRPFAFVLPNMRGGGAERVALYLVGRFLRLGYPVDLVLMEAAGELMDQVPQGARIVDLQAKRFRNAVAPLARYFRQERPRAAQVRMWPLTVVAVIGRLISRSDVRLVLSDHTYLSRHYEGSRQLPLKLSTRLFYPLADARVVVSQGAADDLARLSGLDRDLFEVIYNPLPRKEAVPGSKADQAWQGGGARIISVGTLKPEKNHKLLIRAFALLRRQRPAKLMIVGDGELRSQLEEEAKRLGVAEELLLPGFVADPSDLLGSADLFALSSDYEGFGNVLVEAMRQGVPIVSTDCPSGPREILEGGKFGRLVPCDDEVALAEAMALALDQPVAGDLLKNRAEEISGESPVRRYVELMTGTGMSAPAVGNG